jgi:hypothetical protein
MLLKIPPVACVSSCGLDETATGGFCSSVERVEAALGSASDAAGVFGLLKNETP